MCLFIKRAGIFFEFNLKSNWFSKEFLFYSVQIVHLRVDFSFSRDIKDHAIVLKRNFWYWIPQSPSFVCERTEIVRLNWFQFMPIDKSFPKASLKPHCWFLLSFSLIARYHMTFYLQDCILRTKDSLNCNLNIIEIAWIIEKIISGNMKMHFKNCSKIPIFWYICHIWDFFSSLANC